MLRRGVSFGAALLLAGCLSPGPEPGSGPLTLTASTSRIYEQIYKKLDHPGFEPGYFIVSADGVYSDITYCDEGSGACEVDLIVRRAVDLCDERSDAKCYLMARGDTQIWDGAVKTRVPEYVPPPPPPDPAQVNALYGEPQQPGVPVPAAPATSPSQPVTPATPAPAPAQAVTPAAPAPAAQAGPDAAPKPANEGDAIVAALEPAAAPEPAAQPQIEPSSSPKTVAAADPAPAPAPPPTETASTPPAAAEPPVAAKTPEPKSSAPKPSGANPDGPLSGLSNFALCMVVASDEGAWPTDPRFERLVQEARARGLAPVNCAEVLRGDAGVSMRTIPPSIDHLQFYFCTIAEDERRLNVVERGPESFDKPYTNASAMMGFEACAPYLERINVGYTRNRQLFEKLPDEALCRAAAAVEEWTDLESQQNYVSTAVDRGLAPSDCDALLWSIADSSLNESFRLGYHLTTAVGQDDVGRSGVRLNAGALCRLVLNDSLTGWRTDETLAFHLNEVNARNLTVGLCLALAN